MGNPGAERTRDAYNAAADHYDDPALGFWAHFGERTVERIGLSPGARVLDVCAGSGASALPAARAVGPGGRVIAVDLAADLLARGRAKAAREGLANIEFRAGDMLEVDPALGPFDAVVCVFGIFFVEDMAGAVRRLWSLVRPGGAIAITTWGPRLFEPQASVWWSCVGEVRPDLKASYQPWDRVTTPAQVRALLDDAGVTAEAAPGSVVVEAEERRWPCREPEVFWKIVMGTGFRWTLERLGERAGEVRGRCLERLAGVGEGWTETAVVYAGGRKGG